jgi:hypothetical protein
MSERMVNTGKLELGCLVLKKWWGCNRMNSELEGKFGELNSQSDTGHNHFEVFQMIRIVALGC